VASHSKKEGSAIGGFSFQERRVVYWWVLIPRKKYWLSTQFLGRTSSCITGITSDELTLELVTYMPNIASS